MYNFSVSCKKTRKTEISKNIIQEKKRIGITKVLLVMEEDLTLGGGRMMQYIDDIL